VNRREQIRIFVGKILLKRRAAAVKIVTSLRCHTSFAQVNFPIRVVAVLAAASSEFMDRRLTQSSQWGYARLDGKPER